MAENKLTYKGKPLVRVGNELYYGDPSDKYVLFLSILSDDDADNAKVHVQLLSTNQAMPAKDRIIKETTKNGLYNALDIGTIWLERAIAEE